MTKKTLYVDKIGAVLAREGKRLIIRARDKTIEQEYPIFQIDRVIAIGNVQITGSALDLIISEGIDTVFMTRRGRFKARITTGIGHMAQLRMAQYNHVSEDTERIMMARAFVCGKLRNQRVLAMRRKRSAPEAVNECVARMELAIEQAKTSPTVILLRGYEGIGSKAYFSAFSAALKQDLGFKKRARRPPPDPVNALLSFGYTILLQYCEGALQRTGLDPYLGYLHEIADRKPALTLDFMEEFRPIVVDTVVLRMINRVELTVEDFKRVDKGFHLTKPALARFVNALEARLEESPGATKSGATTLRLAIDEQARQLVRVVLGKKRRYQPLAWR